MLTLTLHRLLIEDQCTHAYVTQILVLKHVGSVPTVYRINLQKQVSTPWVTPIHCDINVTHPSDYFFFSLRRQFSLRAHEIIRLMLAAPRDSFC